MTTLIIPDVHQDIDSVKRILKLEDNGKLDEIIFLGDWLDSFHEPPQVANFKDTCLFLKSLVRDNKNSNKMTFLIGNHDLAYIYNNVFRNPVGKGASSRYLCSGVTAQKISIFKKIFYFDGLKDEWFIKNFKIAHRSQDWIFSHAGLIEQHIPMGLTSHQLVDDVLPEVWRNFRNFLHPQNELISDVGRGRGGWCDFGGILWLDFHCEFCPSINIGKQVFGHTYVPEPQVRGFNKKHESWNIDSNLKFYAKIKDGKLTSHKTPLK